MGKCRTTFLDKYGDDKYGDHDNYEVWKAGWEAALVSFNRELIDGLKRTVELHYSEEPLPSLTVEEELNRIWRKAHRNAVNQIVEGLERGLEERAETLREKHGNPDH